MRYDDNHKERTRARVLAEAAAAIRGKGVERVGVAEVMAGAGLTHGGFYAHFKSKDDLLTEAISYMFDAAYASFLRHTEGRAPADALSNYLDAYLATSHRDDRAHSCPLAALSGDLPNMPALARARLEGKALVDVRDIFVANTWSVSNTNYGGRIAFDRDGYLFLTVGERQEQERAQKPEEHGGKVLRLRDDGTVPPDNPFVGKAGYAPEIYSLGHRSPQGLAFHPDTGELWENEHGPLGGDELNILKPGANYGWPLVTYGTDYDGTKISDLTTRSDLEAPFMYWVPSIAISGITFYTGDRFPQWKGNVFVGSMFAGRTRATGHLVRITFNKGRAIQREPIIAELKQRIRDVRQGPDGLLYVLTDEPNGAVLKIEPAS